MTQRILILAMVVGLLAPGLALAEDGQAATSASGHQGLFNLINGETLCRGDWAFSTYYNKWDRRVQSDPATQVIDPLWTDWDMDVERASIAVGYGLTDRIELALMLPYWNYEADGFDAASGMSQKGILNGRFFEGRIDQSGIGNLRLGAKFQIARTDNYAGAITAFIDAPTGDDDEAVVTGDPGFGIGYAGNSNDWVFNLGYVDPGDSDFLDVSDEVHVGIGYGTDLNERFEWITELAGILYTDSNGEHDAVDITTGGRVHFADPDWAFNFGLRVDLSDTSFDYTPIGGLVGLSYAPKNKFDVSVTLAGSGTGTVTGSMGLIDCSSGTCMATYHCGSALTLTAVPDAKSRFDGWEGDCAGGPGQTAVTLTLDDDKACTAKFVKLYDLTVQTVGKKHPNGDEVGVCKVLIDGEACQGSECMETYDVGTEVGLKAMAGADSTFEGWSVDCSGNDPNTDVTMSSDKTCVATCMGPPRPCIDTPVAGDYAKCGRYVKRGEWSCDSQTWSQVVSGFTQGGFDLPGNQLATDMNERKTPMCDLVNFMRMCPQFKACIAGRAADGEAYCTAEERAARVAGFLQAQSTSPPFANITPDRYEMAPACEAEPGTGMNVEIFLDK